MGITAISAISSTCRIPNFIQENSNKCFALKTAQNWGFKLLENFWIIFSGSVNKWRQRSSKIFLWLHFTWIRSNFQKIRISSSFLSHLLQISFLSRHSWTSFFPKNLKIHSKLWARGCESHLIFKLVEQIVALV